MNTGLTTEMKEFNRLYKETDNLYSRYAASHGISPTMLCILYSAYAEDAPCTQAQLVEDWGIPMQTINSCLKSMEKSGLVRLEFAEGSRKSKSILLTELGQSEAERIIAPLAQAENMALDALGAEARQQLLSLTRQHIGLLRQYLFDTK